MKRSIFLLSALALTIGLAGSALAGAGRGVDKGGAAGQARPLQQVRQVLDKLDLSAEQNQNIDQIIADAQNQLRALREQAKSSGDKSAMKGQVRPLIKAMITKIGQELTPEQRTKFEAELKQVRKDAAAKRRGQGGNAPTSQPQA